MSIDNTPSPAQQGSSYSSEIGMNLIFYNEIGMYSRVHVASIPVFDSGIITEVLGKGKYKVNLQCLGRVVTATSGEGDWVKNSMYLKGGYALVLLQNGKDQFVIISVRQIGVFAPKSAKHTTQVSV